MSGRVRWLTFAGVLALAAAWTGEALFAEGLTAEEIVRRVMAQNAQRQAALEHYESDRTYRLEYRGVGGERSAEMRVHAEFSAPDVKRLTIVSESGSRVMCDRVLQRLVESEEEASQRSNRLQMMLSPENYELRLVGEETIDGRQAWVLQVWPRVASKFAYRGRVWVSEEDYALMRVLGEPAKNPSWWVKRSDIDSRYEKMGQFWLPERSVTVSHVRIGGEATLTIDYGRYTIEAAQGGRNGQAAARSGPR